ncbi:MAG: hypothetical protein P8M02_00555 [Flavobacteriaceae bacterium]|jgi:hypothetical protein|nr:hypothetical protein [Flavobacteriaceae bacterium]
MLRKLAKKGRKLRGFINLAESSILNFDLDTRSPFFWESMASILDHNNIESTLIF